MPILSSIGGGSIRSLGRGIEQEAAVVPAGTVLMWNVANTSAEAVPIGWSVHTGFDGRLVLGTANSAEVGTTSTATGSVSASVATTSNGEHTGTGAFTSPGVVVSGGTFTILGTTDHLGHSHTITVNANTSQLLPNTASLPFITTDTDLPTIPPYAIIFRKVAPTSVNYDHYRPSGNGYFSGSPERGWLLQPSVTTTSNLGGAHDHRTFSQRVNTNSGSGTPGILSTTTGSHVHDAIINISTRLKSKLLKPWTSSQEEQVEPGIIVMYDSSLSTLPSGWRVCNGQNGTEDMVDFFLGYNSSEIHGDIISSSNTVVLSGSTSSNNWNHSHLSGQGPFSNTSRSHGSEDVPHSHNISSSSVSSSYSPPFRRVAFIQYKGI